MIDISVQTPYGSANAMTTWNATFEHFLTEQLQSSLGCTFKLTPLPTPDAAYSRVANNLTDFILLNSGLTRCVQVNTVRRPRVPLSLTCVAISSIVVRRRPCQETCVTELKLFHAAQHPDCTSCYSCQPCWGSGDSYCGGLLICVGKQNKHHFIAGLCGHEGTVCLQISRRCQMAQSECTLIAGVQVLCRKSV